jgi:hypothetical protein
MTKENQSPQIPVDNIWTNKEGQRFMVYPISGQIVRLSEDGRPVPRIRMSKKERRKFRQEYREARDLEPVELANKILETPVINPVSKNGEQKSEELSVPEQKEPTGEC